MRVAFLYSPIAYGSHRPPLDFSDLDGKQGTTGTDLVATKFAAEMARRGHDVFLWCDRAESRMWKGVAVRPFDTWQKFASDNWDAVISASSPNPLEFANPESLRVVNRQVAAFSDNDCTRGWQNFTDLVLCPSKTAVSHVRVPGPEFDVLGNGVDLASFPEVVKVPGRCLYISSPDRGLHWVLQAWPEIRRRVPHATLRVMYYSLGGWLRSHAADRPYANPIDEEMGRRAQYVEMGIRRLSAHGVEVHEAGVSHRALADELAQAECLLYPCDTTSYTETCGVAVLESCAAGALPIISTCDSFGELWAPACPHVDAPVGARIGEWTDLAVKSLTDPAWRNERAAIARRHAEQYSWERVGERLEQIVAEHIDRKRAKGRVYAAMDRLANRTIDMVLTPYASGDWPINPYDPWEAAKGGGCRTGFVLLTRGMAALGWNVRAYSTWGNHDKVAGVEHRPLSELGRQKADALLAYYDTSPLASIRAPLKIASHHTYLPPDVATITMADINVAPSRHAASALQTKYGGRGWGVLPNIVPVDVADVERATVAGRVLYHTSPDRGLHLLVKCWPEIRRAVPHATLHVVGVTDEWIGEACEDKGPIGGRIRELREHITAANLAGGVRLLGRLSRGGVLRELSQAACFAFPCETSPEQPVETWSTAVVEACAAGVPVVLAPQDALEELWGSRVVYSTPPAREHLDEFASFVVKVLSDEEVQYAVAARQRSLVEPYTADNTARILDSMIREHGKAVAA